MIYEIFISCASLAVNSMLVFACHVIARRNYAAASFSQLTGHCVLYYYFTLIAIGQILGATGILFPWVYMAATVIVSLIVLLYDMVYYPRFIVRSIWLSDKKNHFDGLIFCLIIIWLFLFVFLKSLYKFPEEWDALMYHLPYVDQWILSGDLTSKNCWMWSNPGNNELFALWIVCPFSGDFFYTFNNLPSVILTISGISEVLKELRFPRNLACLFAICAVTNYVVVYQLLQAMNDISVVGFYLCALTYALRYSKRKRHADLCGAWLSLGILAGIKYYALGYACVGVSVVLAKTIFSVKKMVKEFTRIAVYTILFTLGWWFWYLRNFLVTGYALFPLGAKSGEDSITNFYPDIIKSTFIGNGSDMLYQLYGKAIYDVCGPFQYISFELLIIVMLFVTEAYTAERSRIIRNNILICSFFLLGALAVFLVTPFAVESEPGTLNQLKWQFCPVRYSSCFLILATVFIGFLSWNFYRRIIKFPLFRGIARRAGVYGLFSLLFSLFFLAVEYRQVVLIDSLFFGSFLPDLFLCLIATFAVASWFFFILRLKIKHYLIGATAVFSVAVFSLGEKYAANNWHNGFDYWYDKAVSNGCLEFIKRKCRSRQKICALDYRVYPLFGSKRDNNIVQIAPMKNELWWRRHIDDLEFSYIVIRIYPNHTINNWNHLMSYFNSDVEKFVPEIVVPGEIIIYRVNTTR